LGVHIARRKSKKTLFVLTIFVSLSFLVFDFISIDKKVLEFEIIVWKGFRDGSEISGKIKSVELTNNGIRTVD
jgi:hypothetical protein